ncbi:MAG: hypothetical protein AAF647_00205 [Pseudomonadota bacterium]
MSLLSVSEYPSLAIEDGLARELDMLEQIKARAQPPLHMVWSADPLCYVAPKAMAPAISGAFEAARSRGVNCHYRTTGGDVVPQGPGILTYSLAFRLPKSDPAAITTAYAEICAPLISALSALGLEARTGAIEGSYCDGAYNVSLGGRKLAGTALRMAVIPRAPGEWAVLGHAMITLTEAALGAFTEVNTLYDAASIKRRIDLATVTSIEGLGLSQAAFRQRLKEALSERYDDALSRPT